MSPSLSFTSLGVRSACSDHLEVVGIVPFAQGGTSSSCSPPLGTFIVTTHPVRLRSRRGLYQSTPTTFALDRRTIFPNSTRTWCSSTRSSTSPLHTPLSASRGSVCLPTYRIMFAQSSPMFRALKHLRHHDRPVRRLRCQTIRPRTSPQHPRPLTPSSSTPTYRSGSWLISAPTRISNGSVFVEFALPDLRGSTSRVRRGDRELRSEFGIAFFYPARSQTV